MASPVAKRHGDSPSMPSLGVPSGSLRRVGPPLPEIEEIKRRMISAVVYSQ